LVEDAPESRSPIRDASPHFSVLKEFKGASYLKRYDLLCQKLVQEQLYTSTALITSSRNAAETGEYSEMSTMTGLKTFVISFAGHIAGESARLGQ
jgi:Restriction endonuclease XhoI